MDLLARNARPPGKPTHQTSTLKPRDTVHLFVCSPTGLQASIVLSVGSVAIEIPSCLLTLLGAEAASLQWWRMGPVAWLLSPLS
jgi:hypothetical protein